MGFAQHRPCRDKKWAENGREQEFPVFCYFLFPFILFEALFGNLFAFFWMVFLVEVCPEKATQATQMMRVILLIFLLGRRLRAAIAEAKDLRLRLPHRLRCTAWPDCMGFAQHRPCRGRNGERRVENKNVSHRPRGLPKGKPRVCLARVPYLYHT